MKFAALKRLAKWLNKKAWWDDKENLDEMRRDFISEVVSTTALSTSEKVELMTDLIYGPSETEGTNEE